MLAKLHENLVLFGLSQKEAEVYIALLTNAELPVDVLAHVTHLNRSTAYVQVQNLIEMGLVTTFKKGKKTFFAAESPRHIERLLEKRQAAIEAQKSELTQLLPNILRLIGSNSERPSVRVFEGKEGLTTMRYDMLDQPITEVKIITSVDHMRRVFSADELMKFSDRREAKKIHSRVLFNDSETEGDITPFAHQTLKRINKSDVPFEADVYIYGDSVSFASVQPTVTGVTIENRGIARTLEALFDTLWQQQSKL